MFDESSNNIMQQEERRHTPLSSTPSIILMAAAASEQVDKEVFEQAWLLAQVFNAKLLACHVIQMHTSSPGNESDGYPGNDQERRIFDKLKDIAYDAIGPSANSTDMQIRILHGDDPAERIVEYADYCSADLIVVGSSNRSGIKKVLLGSVSSAIVSRSKKSVFIVKEHHF
jgi:nucleotide-binding universal stress UspA family protein